MFVLMFICYNDDVASRGGVIESRGVEVSTGYWHSTTVMSQSSAF
jgi:hypothetical protein